MLMAVESIMDSRVLGTDSPEEEYKSCSLLNALQHALLGQVVGAVVVPNLERRGKKEGVSE